MLDTTLTNEILTAHVTNSVLHTAAHSATLSRLFAALSEHTDADAFTAAALVVHWPRRVICLQRYMQQHKRPLLAHCLLHGARNCWCSGYN
jgi:hypothetical protein